MDVAKFQELLDELKIELVFNGSTESKEVARAGGAVADGTTASMAEVLRTLIGAELIPDFRVQPSLEGMVERVQGVTGVFSTAASVLAIPIGLAKRAGLSIDELRSGTDSLTTALDVVKGSLIALAATAIDALRRGQELGLWENNRRGYGIAGVTYTPDGEGDEG